MMSFPTIYLLAEWRMEPQVKTCRDCERTLPITEYYVHPKMMDGRLNKCKQCVRKRVTRHRAHNLNRIRRYDRMRYRRDEYRQRQMRSLLKSRSPEMRRVHYLMGNAIRDGRAIRPEGCWHCGAVCVPEAHHSFYDPDNFDVVTWLCRSCHVLAHKLTQRLRKMELTQ